MDNYKKLFKSFFYAFRGIFSTINSERNMRIHLVCIAYMLGFLLLTDWFVVSKIEWAILLVAICLVVAGELVNTAVESVVDMVTQEYNELAKKAKDAASGAVLVCAIVAVIIGIIVLLQPDAFRAMFTYFKGNILSLILFVISIIPATLFIFFGFGKGKNNG